jgi:hypothetical protein
MPRPFKYIAAIGQKFNRWTVIDDSRADWHVRCECGKDAVMGRHVVMRGLSKSCTSCARKKHGKEGSAIYNIWAGMKQRCQNPKYHGYASYGGRGIQVCERWQSFELFYADMGDPPQGCSLGRMHNDGNYEPGNCQWERPKQQARNKRNTTLVDGVSVAQLAEEHGVPARRVRDRLKAGWPLDKALLTPPDKHNRL